jgi:restriction system protein
MAIPPFHEFFSPVLKFCAVHPEVTKASIREPMARHFGISPEEASALLPSQRVTTLASRISWAFTYLVRSGLIERLSRGVYRITPEGKKVAGRENGSIGIEFLMRYPSFRDYMDKSRNAGGGEDGADCPEGASPEETAAEASLPDSGVPKFESFLKPVLRAVGERDTTTVRGLLEPLAELFGISPEHAAELLPGGSKTRLSDRVGWAMTYLKKAGLVENAARGLYRITPQGRAVVSDDPETLDIAFLERFPSFLSFRSGEDGGQGEAEDAAAEVREAEGPARPDGPADERDWPGCPPLPPGVPSPAGADIGLPPAGPPAEPVLTPDEQMDSASDLHKSALIQELKEAILRLSPTAFEKLILQVMERLKYSSRGEVQHTGRTKDGGIDGIITEDALGLNAIYLQAKRYEDRTVGREAIQAFAGAMDHKGIDKGVFVTSSRFSREAEEFARTSRRHIRLINGDELVELMYRNGIGTRTHRTIEIKRLNEDFFSDLED